MDYNQNLYGKITLNTELIDIFYPPPPEKVFLVSDTGEFISTESGQKFIVD